MKKLLCCLLVMLLLLSFSGCNLITELFVTPVYTSSCTFYINNRSLSAGDSNLSLNEDVLTSSQNLINTYTAIIQSRDLLADVLECSNLSYSVSELREMVTVKGINETEIIQISVSSVIPMDAYMLASGFCEVVPEFIAKIVEGCSVRVVETPYLPSTPDTPTFKLFP